MRAVLRPPKPSATLKDTHTPPSPFPKHRHRFSSDVSTVDDSLPFIFNILLANAASLTGLLVVLTYTEPRLVAALLPLGLLYR